MMAERSGMKKNSRRRKNRMTLVDPFDRDMRVVDAKALFRAYMIKNIVYSKLPPPKKCCDCCSTPLGNNCKVRGIDSNGLECIVYICPACDLMHRL